MSITAEPVGRYGNIEGAHDVAKVPGVILLLSENELTCINDIVIARHDKLL